MRAPSGSFGHKIQNLGGGDYVLSWRTHHKAGRLLASRRFSRDTDRAGAERFARRWNVPIPEAVSGAW